MISMFSMALEGICCNASDASSTEGRPSIKTVKLPLPRRRTEPSRSTVTDGTLLSTSTAVPEAAVRCPSTLITFLSS